MRARDGRYQDGSSAETYANNNSVQFDIAVQFIRENREIIQGPILDIGCGTGELTAYIGKELQQPIHGVDISSDRIEYAISHHSSMTTTFSVADAVQLGKVSDLISQHYYTVVSFNAIHHIPEPLLEETFVQIRKRLHPLGWAILLMPGKNPEMHDSIHEIATSEKWLGYFSDFSMSAVRTYQTAEYYQSLCARTGFFSVKSSTSIEHSPNTYTFDEVKDYLKGWLPHLVHLKNKIDDASMYHKLEDELLRDITQVYFNQLGKSVDERITIDVIENKIIAQANLRDNSVPSIRHAPIRAKL